MHQISAAPKPGHREKQKYYSEADFKKLILISKSTI